MGVNFALVGATGLVGGTVLKVLEEYGLPIDGIKLLASERSEGELLNFNGCPRVVERLCKNSFKGVDYAVFCAGSSVSDVYAPIAAYEGATVIDNSSAFRRDDDVPLIVPEVNMSAYHGQKIISNPNCSTIQCMLPLKILSKFYGLKSVNFTTYQAVSGSGDKGISDLKRTLNGKNPLFYPCDISKTCLPQIGNINKNGYSDEEEKMSFEAKKILELKKLKVSATCVRVPVCNCHAVSVSASLSRPFCIDDVISALKNTSGLVYDGVPTAISANNQNNVYVGRVRRDASRRNGILFYTVADNLRKGAATNAVQILYEILKERDVK